MKKLIACSIVLGLTLSARALPIYDNFSTYGAPGTWTEVSGPPIVSYTTSAPLLGGATAPSGESWLVYTNAPVVDLYVNYYSRDFTGYNSQNVAVVNYFGVGQPGASDTPAPNLPTGYPGPFVSGNDTRTNSIWTPGWSQTGESNPALQNYLGGVGACLQFASPVAAVPGAKVFVSFFVDIPDCTGSFGAGQSLLHGYSAGFINSAELPNISANQYGVPSLSLTGYASIPLMAKFNVREGSASSWKPGVGCHDDNGFSAGAVNQKTVHFIVMSYEFNGGPTDKIGVWEDPAAALFAAATEPGFSASESPSNSLYLPDAGGFFFLANTQDGGATPNSGILFNSLSIGTNWAYVTGGLQNIPAGSVTVAAGRTAVLNPPLAAGGGVSMSSVTWANSSGPCTGGRYTVNATTGALSISGVVAGDADIYTATGTTPIASENGVAAVTALNTVPLTVLTSENASAISAGQFTLNFTGPVGVGYRIWSTTSFTPNYPVIGSPGWTQVSSGTYISGMNSYTDTAATGQTKYYTITVP